MLLSKILMMSGIMLALVVGTSSMATTKSTSGASNLAKDTVGETPPAGTRRRIFISGHSLTDRPFPDYLVEIAAAAGIEMSWDMQNLTGSSIRQRLDDAPSAFVATARTGENQAPPESSRAYDLMIITEQHRVLDSLIWQDSFNALETYQDRFIAANPGARTYFFAPWMSLSDKSDPREWIEFERQALPVWQCIVAEVNQDIAAAGRADRIEFIPASWALASLVDHLTSKTDAVGFEGLDTRAKIGALFSDDVHLSPLGAYYVSAITHSAIYPGDPPRVQPPSLNPSQAQAVQSFATEFMQENSRIPVSSERDCSTVISLAFASHYAGYAERTYHRSEQGFVGARIKRIRDTLRFAWRFRHGIR